MNVRVNITLSKTNSSPPENKHLSKGQDCLPTDSIFRGELLASGRVTLHQTKSVFMHRKCGDEMVEL